MAYSDDAVRAKLAALNETQDSIVSNAQWIMFHRRFAAKTASVWLNRLQENTNASKRLNLIYLANEVVQQSRARSKQDFLLAFEPLIADATAAAYKGSSQDIQGKIRRVVEVWRQRGIFDNRIQEQIEKRLEELDKQKGGKTLGGGGGGRLGGSLFGGSTAAGGVVSELEGINKSFTALNKATSTAKVPVATASDEYSKWNDPSTSIPSAPVHAARLRGLVKDLTAAHLAVGEKIKTQRELIEGLEKLLESTRTKLAEDEEISNDFSAKIDSTQAKVTEVEDSIMRGQESTLGAESYDRDGSAPARPDTEGFTPPPPDVESFTPPPNNDDDLPFNGANIMTNTEPLETQDPSSISNDQIPTQSNTFNEPPPSFEISSSLAQQQAAAAAQDFLKNLMPHIRKASDEIPEHASNGSEGDPRLKRSKQSNYEDDDGFGGVSVGGVDEDGVSALLGS
jgi:regulator of Ty1 transposition protein 103